MIFEAVIMYLLSVLSMWLYVKCFYSKSGRGVSDRNNDKELNSSILFVLCPILNTVLCLCWIFYFPLKGRVFFGIKND